MNDQLPDDVAAIRMRIARFAEAQRQLSTAAARTDDALAIAQKLLAAYPIPPDSPEYQQLARSAQTYCGAIEMATQRIEYSGTALTSGSLMMTGIAAAVTHFYPQQSPVVTQDIETHNQRFEVRDQVYGRLRGHSPRIADMFQSSLQSLEIPATDPARGPAFLMREAVSQFFDHFAPGDAIESQPWWRRYDEKTKFTHRDRIRFIVEHSLLPQHRGDPLIGRHLNDLKAVYDGLNKAHNRAPLDVGIVRAQLYQAQALLSVLLPALSPCPHGIVSPAAPTSS